MSYYSELEAELEFAPPPQLKSSTGAAPGRIQIRYLETPEVEFEVERFDPRPPPQGSTLLTHFSFGSFALTSTHLDTINRVAPLLVARMRTVPPLCQLAVIIEGHEDEVGDPARFGALGRSRAAAVSRALVPRLGTLIAGLPPASRRDVLILIGTAGPTRPIRSNVTADGRAFNRRVEIRAAQRCPVIA